MKIQCFFNISKFLRHIVWHHHNAHFVKVSSFLTKKHTHTQTTFEIKQLNQALLSVTITKRKTLCNPGGADYIKLQSWKATLLNCAGLFVVCSAWQEHLSSWKMKINVDIGWQHSVQCNLAVMLFLKWITYNMYRLWTCKLRFPNYSGREEALLRQTCSQGEAIRSNYNWQYAIIKRNTWCKRGPVASDPANNLMSRQLML